MDIYDSFIKTEKNQEIDRLNYLICSINAVHTDKKNHKKVQAEAKNSLISYSKTLTETLLDKKENKGTSLTEFMGMKPKKTLNKPQFFEYLKSMSNQIFNK